MLFLAVLVVASLSLDSIARFAIVAAAALLPLVPVVGHSLGTVLRFLAIPESLVPDPQLAAGLLSLATLAILVALPARPSSAAGWKRTKATDAIAAAANSILNQ